MNNTIRILAPVIVVTVLNFALWLWAGWNDPAISAENGWLESFQAICLAAGAAVLAAAIFRAIDSERRLLYAGLTLFYVNFLLREINVRNLGLPPQAVYFLGGAGRNWALAILWLVLFVLFLRRRARIIPLTLAWLKTAPALILILAGVFYVAGIPFDKKIFGLTAEAHELFEEIFETQAALLMLFAAVLSLMRAAKP